MEESQTIWYPGIYSGRSEEEWTQVIDNVDLDDIIERVQRRADEDGEWAIKNGFVGDNEDKMRRMMKWVAKEEHIRQCIDHIYREGKEKERSVDFVCRDLANGSKWSVV